MSDIKAKEERIERSPAWQQHIAELAGISQAGDASFFPAGTKTMRHQEMDSANKRHRQSIASQERMQGAQLAQQYKMHAENLAHQRWYDQQRMDLAWAEYNATKEALRGVGDDPYGTAGAEAVLQGGQAIGQDTIDAHGQALGYLFGGSHFSRHFDNAKPAARTPSSNTQVAGVQAQPVNQRPALGLGPQPVDINQRGINLPSFKWDNPFSSSTWKP